MDALNDLLVRLPAPDAGRLAAFLERGGPALWAIAALSVLTLALILWKTWRLARAGAWARRRAELFVRAWETGGTPHMPGRQPRALRLRFAAGVAELVRSGRLAPDPLREEIARRAQRDLAHLRAGLRPLELVVTIAPLIGLLGTVLGMIEAFQALQETGARADPAVLAGGIWEALLTTAAGMAVAIPAAVALSWFEGVAEAVQRDMEDIATRLVLHPRSRHAETDEAA
jgi:biopolymer transport protein ExbB